MLDKITECFTIKLIKENAIEVNKKDIYAYGFKLFVSTSCSLVMILLISVLTKNTANGIIYLIVFMSLRITANGYHADTFLGCFIVTNLFFLIYIVSIRYIPISSSGTENKILIIISLIYIWIKAPIEHPNHKLSNKNRIKNRIAARCIILFHVSAVFILYDVNFNEIAHAISITIYIVIIMMLIKNRR